MKNRKRNKFIHIFSVTPGLFFLTGITTIQSEGIAATSVLNSIAPGLASLSMPPGFD